MISFTEDFKYAVVHIQLSLKGNVECRKPSWGCIGIEPQPPYLTSLCIATHTIQKTFVFDHSTPQIFTNPVSSSPQNITAPPPDPFIVAPLSLGGKLSRSSSPKLTKSQLTY
jgi:hypothetical protein